MCWERQSHLPRFKFVGKSACFQPFRRVGARKTQMASRLSHDDEFDWAAAVREIDVACQRVALASNNDDFSCVNPNETWPIGCNAQANGVSAKGRKEAGVRQSTLDGFVRTDGKCVSMDALVNLDYNLCSNEAPCTKIDLEAAKTWVYPVNIPLRDYQLSITKTALFSNTLVALPTGLGKTLIAAVVMYNYFRWFPEGKIVFAAPSRPLVMQQIEACHNIVGIPQEWTIDMTGQMSPSARPSFWKAKRIFFLTPQVLEKDIRSGICMVKQIVCLVIDEAHRAMGNYSYCVAVHELMAVPVQFRILALTATPGSKQQIVQKVIDNLHISILEYRNESHPDVSPYVHSRKLELIKVAMGHDSITINKLLLEVIQPFVSRLNVLGVLSNRDSASLSPCQLLTSRDKFRQAPPMNLPHEKFGEVEGFFGVLITLYHIRKLLSSHGIKPAYEMLHEKLQQGSFARIMCRNESVWKAKLLMEQSLSHGPPNPKLLKMVDILVDHFKTKDPKNSRVIIFSNFRGSVKDIMETLSNIGESIKATQFIGQNSGKTSTGQSQKLQQAVLKKFRAGGYNVIVATSIGEEGLDIMEVDLVICFDANISPLRMIQRMGRTGRKHNGRVVVLACEGAELKGYLTKQESSKSIAKHMHNGGTNSFNFHSSPRMVPHICKPQVQFVELAIEQFVPRGRKGKHEIVDESNCRNNISDSEAGLIAKYFGSSEDIWKPSLIAFPHFQGFPSRVHKVRHSFRTTAMLIDTVQFLKELSSFKGEPTHQVEFCTSLSQHLEAVDVAQDCSNEKDSTRNSESLQALPESKISDIKPDPPKGTCRTDDEQHIPDVSNLNAPFHSFLFGAEFVSVNAVGRVLITSVPMLPLVKEPLNSKGISTENFTGILTSTNKDTSPCRTIPEESDKQTLAYFDKSLAFCAAHPQPTVDCIDETVPQTPIVGGKLTENSDDDDDDYETPKNQKKELPHLLISESRAMELSPRLTDYAEKGIVPESPMVERAVHHSSMVKPEPGISCVSDLNIYEKKTPTSKTSCSTKLFDTQEKYEASAMPHVSHNMRQASTETFHPLNLSSEENKKADVDANSGEIILEGIELSTSPVDKENRTPLVNQTSSNCIKDWQISTGEASKKSIQQPRKLKRLRKYGDIGQMPLSSRTMRNKCSGIRTNLCEVFTATELRTMKRRTSGRLDPKARLEDFIDKEAEVSSDEEVSADEDDGMDDSEYDDSFIDDRVNPTVASTQAEDGGDMMAVYRRSLLTQSPADDQLNWYYSNIAHESGSPTPTGSESCSSTKMNNSLQRTPFGRGPPTPNQSNGRNIMASHELGSESVSMAAMACKSETTAKQREEGKIDIRKRKLSFKQQEEHWLQPETTSKTSLDHQSHNPGLDCDPFDDDRFYESLDLDEMEAQAAKILRHKSEVSISKKKIESSVSFVKVTEDLGEDFLLSPSFDLGI